MKRQAGFTLIEVIVSLAVMAIFVIAIGDLFSFNLSSVTLGKARATALQLANQQMEYLRDLPYDSLATQYGAIYPPGTIPDNKTVVSNGYSFRIHTVIQYVDVTYDYKQAEVTVYLTNTGTQVAQLSTFVSAKSASTPGDTGVILVKVVNASGAPVAGATVHITNPNPNPAVNITATTDNSGILEVPALPPDSTNSYQVSATQTGYSTDSTEPNASGSQKPVEGNLNVISQQISSVTLAIDQLSTLTINAVTPSGAPISGLAITATGEKETYTDPTVYKNVVTGTTNSSGTLTLPNLEWDGYSFSVPSGYVITSSSPYAPAALNPNSSLTVTLTVSTNNQLPIVTSVSPQNAAAGGPVTLTINGSNLNNASFSINQGGSGTITATGVSGSSSQITGTLDLTTANSGTWNITVTNSAGTTTQTGGLNVTN